jgi:hypothetical protein
VPRPTDIGALGEYLEKGGLNLVPASGVAAMQITPTGATPASTSTGGAVNINNSGADGAALVIFSSHAAGATGRLLVIRNSNSAFDQNLVYIEPVNASFGLAITRPAGVVRGDVGNPPPASNALSVTVNEPSNNTDLLELDSALGVSGFELARGTVKITHNRPTNGASNDDASASAISIVLQGSGTRAKALHCDTHATLTADARLVDIRTRGAAGGGTVANQRLVLIDKATGAGGANLLLFGATEPATGQGGVSLPNAAVAPAAVANQGTLYVSAGSLRWRGPSTDSLVAAA